MGHGCWDPETGAVCVCVGGGGYQVRFGFCLLCFQQADGPGPTVHDISVLPAMPPNFCIAPQAYLGGRGDQGRGFVTSCDLPGCKFVAGLARVPRDLALHTKLVTAVRARGVGDDPVRSPNKGAKLCWCVLCGKLHAHLSLGAITARTLSFERRRAAAGTQKQ